MMRWTKEQNTFLFETQHLLTGEAYKLFCERYGNVTSYMAFSCKRSKVNCCKAETKKLKWKPEMLQYIVDTKGLKREEAYKAFILKFGNVVTETAFYNQRSRSGVSPHNPHGSNKKKPLYSEHDKAGYIYIKVAEPNVWISKARWIYEETHPGELTDPGDEFHFANGIKNDFKPDNIIKVKQRERTIFLQYGGCDTDPSVTRTRLLQAKLKVAQLDLGEKAGLVINYGSGRRFK